MVKQVDTALCMRFNLRKLGDEKLFQGESRGHMCRRHGVHFVRNVRKCQEIQINRENCQKTVRKNGIFLKCQGKSVESLKFVHFQPYRS